MEIVAGIHWIKGINGNVYFIINDSGLTLIDTGLPHKAKKILQYMEEVLHRPPQDLKTIILTHGDVDHVGNLTDLKQACGATIAAHSMETDYIAGRSFKPMPNKLIFKILKPLMKLFANFPRTEVDLKLAENDVIDDLTVIFTPGHTPGSIALYDPCRKALFSGDTILSSKGKATGPRDSFTPDMAAAWASIDKLKKLDFDVLLPGHGEPITTDAATQVRALNRILIKKNS